eukprot:Tbor_TRINITY_DN5887_c1_g2::TRINITY_DN5887_c1_g2_i1::g.6265::m.6265
MRSTVVLLLVSAVLFQQEAHAWWCTGHMTVAHIAKRVMSKSTIDTVESVIATLSKEGPFPKNPDMVQVGCWADDIKEDHLYSMASWHFIDRPYTDDNTNISGHPMQEENVATVLQQLDESSKKNSRGNEWILGFSIANLIHFYGDIHQPLHAISLFNRKYPNGDHGGNAQHVTVDGVQTRLHFIWDSICWEYTKELDRPLSYSDNQIIVDLANRLVETYPVEPWEMKVYNSTVMSLESYIDAIRYAYPGTYDGMTITEEYLARCKPIAERRLVLAGLRLGEQLEYIFHHYGHDFFLAAHKIHEHIAKGMVKLGR